jgi:hypothetical protein
MCGRYVSHDDAAIEREFNLVHSLGFVGRPSYNVAPTQFMPIVRAVDGVRTLSLRHQRSKPNAESLRQWLIRQRGQVPDGSATRKAIEYSLGRWAALTRYLDDGDLPIDNNHVENRIRPIALGRSSWLFAGSLRAGLLLRRS